MMLTKATSGNGFHGKPGHKKSLKTAIETSFQGFVKCGIAYVPS